MKLTLVWFVPVVIGTCQITMGCGAGYEPTSSQSPIATADAGIGGDGLAFNAPETESNQGTYALGAPNANTETHEGFYVFDLGAQADASADVATEMSVAVQEDASPTPDTASGADAVADASTSPDTGSHDTAQAQPDAVVVVVPDTSDGGPAEEVVPDPPSLPDYRIESLDMPESVMMGEMLDVTVVIENAGPVDGESDFLWCKVILSSDEAPDTFDDDFWLMGDGVAEVQGPIAAGAFADGSHSFEMFPWDDFNGAGTYYVFVEIRTMMDEEEISTENNIYQHHSTLVVTEFEGQSVTIETYPTADPDRVGTTLQVYQSDGWSVPYFWGGIETSEDGYERWVGELPPGVYHIEVGSYGWDGFGAYSIMFYSGEGPEPIYEAEGFDQDDPDSYEPDDDWEHATPLPMDEQQNHTLTISPYPTNYYDWFEIVVE